MSNDAIRLVRELCKSAAQSSDATLRTRATSLCDQFSEPLRVGVVGRVNAGKSTLVNALIGQQVARTGPTECTQEVTWFRYGTFDHVEIVTRDGRTIPRRLMNGAIPHDLQVPSAEIDHVEVFLSTAELAHLVIIDTPGLGSLNIEASARGAAVVRADGSEQVDAVVFVFDSDTAVGVDQQALLTEFTSMTGSETPPNALGVLSKADIAGSGNDPWPAAHRLARSVATALPGVFADVLPVCGLLAETVTAGLFTEDDAEDLWVLAKEDDSSRRAMMLSPERFVRVDVAISAKKRQQLLDRLGLHGVAVCLSAIDRGMRGAVALSGLLRTSSCFGAVQDAIRTAFVRHSDAVKASVVLGRLEALAYEPLINLDTRLWVGDQVEVLRLDPRLHIFSELEALAAIARQEVDLPGDLAVSMRRLVECSDDAARVGLSAQASAVDVARTARELAARFRSFAFHGSPHAQRIAVIAERSHLLLADRVLKGGRP